MRYTTTNKKVPSRGMASIMGDFSRVHLFPSPSYFSLLDRGLSVVWALVSNSNHHAIKYSLSLPSCSCLGIKKSSKMLFPESSETASRNKRTDTAIAFLTYPLCERNPCCLTTLSHTPLTSSSAPKMLLGYLVTCDLE